MTFKGGTKKIGWSFTSLHSQAPLFIGFYQVLCGGMGSTFADTKGTVAAFDPTHCHAILALRSEYLTIVSIITLPPTETGQVWKNGLTGVS